MTYKEYREKGYVFDVDSNNMVILEDATGGIVVFKTYVSRKRYKTDDEFLRAIWRDIHDRTNKTDLYLLSF